MHPGPRFDSGWRHVEDTVASRRAQIDRFARQPPRTAAEIRAAAAASWSHQPGDCWCGGSHSHIGAHLAALADQRAAQAYPATEETGQSC